MKKQEVRKKTYEKPQVLSSEAFEAEAALCTEFVDCTTDEFIS